ncbi:swt1 RNA endoribonuclease [Musca autumnalis]|uniref:swt1 RNA endoribonuclease n=1 Tax=Musca autumnalis TaxID=221902 RepID=UPI003CEFC30D
MDEKKPKKPDDWIKVQSKSRPGRYYMFNRATGETKWLPTESKSNGDSKDKSPTKKKSITEESQESPPPRIAAPKPLKTPAQDRLKRLQHEIKIQQSKKQETTTKNKRRGATTETESKLAKLTDSKAQQENRPLSVVSKEIPTSSRSKSTKLAESTKDKQEKSTENEISKKLSTSPQKSKLRKSTKDSDEHAAIAKFKIPKKTSATKKEEKPTTDSPEKPPSLTKRLHSKRFESNDAEDKEEKVSSSANKSASKRSHSEIYESTPVVNKNPSDVLLAAFSHSDVSESTPPAVKKSPSDVLLSALSAKTLPPLETPEKCSLPLTPETRNLLDEDTEMIPCDAVENNTKNSPSNKSSTFDNIRTGIVNKIKEICKLPFRSSSKQEVEQKKSSALVTKPYFKPPKKTENKLELSSFPVQQALSELREAQMATSKDNSHDISATSSTSLLNFTTPPSTPTNLNIPSYTKGSANSRLERLRQSLQIQQQTMQSNSAPPVSNKDAFFSFSNATSPSPTMKMDSSLNETTNSIFHTANNTMEEESEEMDWEPFVKEDNNDTIEISSIECNLSLVATKQTNIVKSSSTKSLPETMGDILDAVNENLLRLAAERRSNSMGANNNKWRKDYYYFVVDTNVLLDHLAFLEDLTQLKLCDTQGSMLYIPYGVLQELDKLKMRSGCKEGVKTLAVRAIKYLNKKLENKSENVLAQTALEERHHLIDVNSADDSIINCCLQAKAQIPNILLLTEDVNLRNKAMCNNILVATKSDLLSKRYDVQTTSSS